MRVTKTTILVIACLVLSALPAAQNAFGQQSGRKNIKSAEQELMRLDDEVFRASNRRDAATLNRLIADDYSGNGVHNKTQTVTAWTKSDSEGVQETSASSEMRARVYGRVAVVTGVDTTTRKGKDGEHVSQERYCDIWEKRKGRWLLISAYSVPVKQKATADNPSQSVMSGDQIERDEQELIRLTNELLRSAVDDDAAPLERLLDDNYVSIDFGNKSKDKAALTKLWTTKNPKETAKSTITADDFQFHFYGDTAIVAYKITDVFRGNKGEQTFHDYSFDVWKKSGEGWRLVSSSTAALLPGRKVIALDAKTLDAYAGVYRSPEGDTFSITRKGDKLLVSISDGTKFDLVPQTEIEFYSPSNSIVSMFFVRDEQGRVAYAITRFYGTDTTLKKIK